MAKTATKAAAKPAARPAANAGASKAQRAAQSQGRDPQPSSGQRAAPPAEPKRNTLPARQQASTPAAFGDVNQVPAHMRADMGAGKEQLGREDIETPRLKLIQGLSPELQEYNDLRPGHFFHSASETIFDEPFRAVPIFIDKQYILWRPRDSGGGILARAPNGRDWQPGQGEFEVTLDKKDGGKKVVWKMAPTVQQSGLAEWGTMDPTDPKSPPAATLIYNFVLAFPDNPEILPAALSFQRSSIKMGRKLITKLMSNRFPIYGLIYTFSSTDDTNTRGQDFKNVSAQGAGMVEDPELYEMYKSMHESLKNVGLQLKDIDGLQDEATGDNVTDEGPAASGPGRF